MLGNLKKSYLEQNKHHDHNTKYWGIKTIKYLFYEGKDHYKLNLINYAPNYQQYQNDSDKKLLPPNKY